MLTIKDDIVLSHRYFLRKLVTKNLFKIKIRVRLQRFHNKYLYLIVFYFAKYREVSIKNSYVTIFIVSAVMSEANEIA